MSELHKLRLSENQHFIENEDGTPFFWLADTAWNGVLRGDDDNWEKYLQHRQKQGFTVIQYVAANWRGHAKDACGEEAWLELDPIKINTAFFDRLENRVAMINQYGLIAAPVVLWSLLDSDPGCSLSNDDAIELARYIVNRYKKYNVVWLFGGDCDYQKRGVELWCQRVKAVFGENHNQLITLHPCGQNWVGEYFRNEPWYDIIGYQSGHGDGEDHVAWLLKGAPAHEWKNQPAKPVINLEPNYESAHGYQHQTCFSDYHVRRASYWSLLIAPTAGITYGHDAIWNWNFETGPSEGHGNWGDGKIPPWHTALETPGINSMTILRSLMDQIEWWKLSPCQELLAEQPGEHDIEHFVTAAKAEDNSLGLVYVPAESTLNMAENEFKKATWFNPRSGEKSPASDVTGKIQLPDEQDWVLVLQKSNT